MRVLSEVEGFSPEKIEVIFNSLEEFLISYYREEAMIVVMKADEKDGSIEEILQRLGRRGLRGQVSQGVERIVIGVLGSIPPELQGELEMMPGVVEVLPVSKPYKLASREFHPGDTVVQVGDVAIGGDNPLVVMAGPCAVEDEGQVLSTARSVKAAGAKILRGGAFKPRTSPYSFRGMGVEGLKILAEARKETGLLIITEVMAPNDVEAVSQYADILQIGARNMQNFSLLDEVGRIRKPVMLKRSFSATYEDWLLAAEYILAGGNTQVMLCERGIRTFETYTRNTMDIAAMPSLRKLSHLPVIADPSHAAGKAELVTPLALAAVVAGCRGLLIEVHPRPSEAKCDGAQSLTFKDFAILMGQVTAIRNAMLSEVAV